MSSTVDVEGVSSVCLLLRFLSLIELWALARAPKDIEASEALISSLGGSEDAESDSASDSASEAAASSELLFSGACNMYIS